MSEESEENKKKARNFDFMAMFEQARKTAIERTQESSVREEEAELRGTKSARPPDSSSSSDSDSEPESEKKQKHDKNRTKLDKDKASNVRGNDSGEDLVGPPIPSHFKVSSKIDEEDEDLIGPPIPPSLKNSSQTKGEEDLIGPPVPANIQTGIERREDSDEEEDSEEEDDVPVKKIPDSEEIVLEHGHKTVSALALDPAGARLVTGGYDFDVRLWDFAGMDSSLNYFRALRPCECHQIKQLQYSPTGDLILVIAGNAKAKVLDRDGHEKFECSKGDQYIVDMAKTKGHTAMLNCGCWNPKKREEFMTCSNDGTVRLWDINQEGKKQKTVLKPRSQQGRITIPTTCTYSPDGRWVVCACQDGSMQVWDHNKSMVNIAMTNRTAHMNGSETSCLCFSYDGKTLASRGGDDTLKMWDMRNFKQPLNVKKDLLNFFPITDCLFSPDDRLVVTGTSVKKSEGKGKLLFMDRETLQLQKEMVVSDKSVVRCLWHPKLNQIVVGCGDGKAKLYYDPKKSHRGAMLCMGKQPKKTRQVMEGVASQQVITPYALPMFRKGRETSTKKHEERVRKDPVKSKRPDLPIYGPGEGGRLGAKGATLSQYVVQNLVVPKPDPYEDNPREAILRHAEEAAKNPFWVAPAYKKTQPNTIFQAEEEDKSEDDDDDEPLWKKSKLS